MKRMKTFEDSYIAVDHATFYRFRYTHSPCFFCNMKNFRWQRYLANDDVKEDGASAMAIAAPVNVVFLTRSASFVIASKLCSLNHRVRTTKIPNSTKQFQTAHM